MKVTIYGKQQCPNCTRAKELCEARGIDYEYIDFVETGMTKQQLEAIMGTPVSSVPQILVDDKPVGGYNHLTTHLQFAGK